MAIAYPDISGPLVPQTKTQATTFRRSTPLEGPAYLQTLSDDAPAFYDLVFRFERISEAKIFYAWVVVNKIYAGVAFDCPIATPFSDEGITTQEVELMEGDLRSWEIGKHYVEFKGLFRAREEVTGLEDLYEFLEQETVCDIYDSGQLDIDININLPED